MENNDDLFTQSDVQILHKKKIINSKSYQNKSSSYKNKNSLNLKNGLIENSRNKNTEENYLSEIYKLSNEHGDPTDPNYKIIVDNSKILKNIKELSTETRSDGNTDNNYLSLIVLIFSISLSVFNYGLYRKFINNYDKGEFKNNLGRYNYINHNKSNTSNTEKSNDAFTIEYDKNYLLDELMFFSWRMQFILFILIIYLVIIKIVKLSYLKIKENEKEKVQQSTINGYYSNSEYLLSNEMSNDNSFFEQFLDMHEFKMLTFKLNYNDCIFSFLNFLISFLLLFSTSIIPISILILLSNSDNFLRQFFNKDDKENVEKANQTQSHSQFNTNNHNGKNILDLKKNETSTNFNYINEIKNRLIDNDNLDSYEEEQLMKRIINDRQISGRDKFNVENIKNFDTNFLNTNENSQESESESDKIIKFFSSIMFIMGLLMLIFYNTYIINLIGISSPFISIFLNIGYQKKYIEKSKAKPFQMIFFAMLSSTIISILVFALISFIFNSKLDLLSLLKWSELNQNGLYFLILTGIIGSFNLIFMILSGSFKNSESIKLIRILEPLSAEIICIFILNLYEIQEKAVYYFGILNVLIVIIVIEYKDQFSKNYNLKRE